ncbi:hypothetical protein SK128_003275 [Halocaridina rubra]|uniref:Uncharacterized protein n=1 Tax=Halocaridina rubra TaxID=373956 RepID=A0AAN8WJ23_HALRR
MSNLERIEECSLTDEYIIDMITDMERIPDNDGQVYTLHIENTTQDVVSKS